MKKVTVERLIDAPKEQVFDVVARIENFEKAVPHLTKVEMLTDTTRGVGTRFRETRVMKGREASTELEVTEYIANERIRLVSDTGGAIWDSVFTVSAANGDTRLKLEMDARPHSFVAKLVTPFLIGMITNAVAEDMDAVKAYCENS